MCDSVFEARKYERWFLKLAGFRRISHTCVRLLPIDLSSMAKSWVGLHLFSLKAKGLSMPPISPGSRRSPCKSLPNPVQWGEAVGIHYEATLSIALASLSEI